MCAARRAAETMQEFHVGELNMARRKPLTLTMCAVVAMTACRVSIVHITWRGKWAWDGEKYGTEGTVQPISRGRENGVTGRARRA